MPNIPNNTTRMTARGNNTVSGLFSFHENELIFRENIGISETSSNDVMIASAESRGINTGGER